MARPKTVSDADLARVARSVFLREGTDAPVATVAKELGITPAALFHRVKTKERLLVIALWPGEPPAVTLLTLPVSRPGLARQQLLKILYGLNEFFAVAVPAAFLLHRGGVSARGLRGKNAPLMIRLRGMLAHWLDAVHLQSEFGCRNSRIASEALLGALEARQMHAYLCEFKYTASQNNRFVRELVEQVLTKR
jgi:AcrR family transcriptional regulator